MTEQPRSQEAARLHPDDGYAYEGCGGPACRNARLATFDEATFAATLWHVTEQHGASLNADKCRDHVTARLAALAPTPPERIACAADESSCFDEDCPKHGETLP